MQIDFNKTPFYNGTNSAYGKVPITLEASLDVIDIKSLESDNQADAASSKYDASSLDIASRRRPISFMVKLELSIGAEKLYGINDIYRFLDAFEKHQPFHFSKNFIFEPDKMYLKKADKKLLDFLYSLTIKREYHGTPLFHHTMKKGLPLCEMIFDEIEAEGLLDLIFDEITNINFRKQASPLHFQNDINLRINVEKNGSMNLMNVDYSDHGSFDPLSINFKYVYFKHKKLIAKLPDEKQEFLMNLYEFQNDENIISFKISAGEMRLFQKNFLEPYSDKLGVTVDKKIAKELNANRLLAKIFFDVAAIGIISKIEFCYEDKSFNPLYDEGTDKSFREISEENKVLDKLKALGFREYGRLFLLDDLEKITFLLTDKLTDLKKSAEIYYSVDFKSLHVKNLDSLGLSLSEDSSIIHMDINLENVTDEELIRLLEAIKKGKKYYRLFNGSIINLNSASSGSLVQLINSLDINKDNVNDGLFEVPLNRLMYIDKYLEEKDIENVKIDDGLGYLMEKIKSPDNIDKRHSIETGLPEKLKEVLRNYQMIGVSWLETMSSYSFGGILADDMGLGKTLQVLAFIAYKKHADQNNELLPCIVIAPTSVVYIWQSEAEKFTPELKTVVITGSKEKRSLLISLYKDYDLIITSYGSLKNDIGDYKQKKFLYIFLDEAQNIKNPETLNAGSVKSLTAECAFALTGTPIENKLTELWSIFDFVMPGFLSEHTKFMRTFEEPIMRDKSSEKMEDLKRLINPFIIRRLKRDVLSELPEKIETNYMAEMKEEQKKLYAAFYKDFKRELITKLDESGLARNHIEVLSALTRLRQICAHPGTFLNSYSGGSGKLDLAMELITKSVGLGHSILLFSQFTAMLKIIRDELELHGINYYYLDGSMTPEDRMIEVDNFNSDKDSVFLISLKAGGTGLNLTKADVVIHFDPWWNPAVENQASDRAHRFGQKNTVQVYNLLTEGTIEEMVAKLKERKKDLFEGLIRPGEGLLNKLSEEDVRNIFSQPSF